jgi:hypothetical protein
MSQLIIQYLAYGHPTRICDNLKLKATLLVTHQSCAQNRISLPIAIIR